MAAMFRAFAWRIVLPTLLSVALFVIAIFLVLIPAFERSVMERKREMIRELTNSAWNILANHEQQVKDGRVTREEAQAGALRQIQHLHYGHQMKDYFWVNDMHPRMVAHPYRHDLEGKDLTDFVDPSGKRMFVEMVQVVSRDGAGFVEYQWQWKDDPNTIVPKLSFVKGFEPWGWVIGTGIYIQDVKEEISQITRRLIAWSTAILLVLLGLLGFIMRQSWAIEKKRRAAEEALGQRAERLSEQVVDLQAHSTRHETAMQELRMTLALLQQNAGAGDFRLLDEIRRAKSADEVVRLNQSLPMVVRALSDSGAPAAWVNRLITLDSDAVLNRLAELAIAAMGPPPAPFVILIMGSEGRREQTLSTDQDNAILFADVEPQKLTATRAYFEELGTRVCDDLHKAGYTWCEGQVMAKNPKWCQPMSVWKGYFSGWINTLEAQDLLQAKIFFDFRAGYGTEGASELADELREYLWSELKQAPRFFVQLARNVLLFAPPVGVFGQFHLESGPDGRKGLGIKSAMTPVVDFARIYALRHHIAETGTIPRLAALRDAGVLQAQPVQEIAEVYGALMQIRIANQVRAMRESRMPDNFIEPSRLSYLEQRILKESFTQIRHFQTRLSYDFTGMSEVPA